MWGILIALGAGLYLASKGIVKIGALPGVPQVYVYDVYFQWQKDHWEKQADYGPHVMDERLARATPPIFSESWMKAQDFARAFPDVPISYLVAVRQVFNYQTQRWETTQVANNWS